MLIGILADVHANHLALEACLAEAEALKVEQLVFLGDLVGYGPEPESVVERIADLTAAGAITIKGNHDDAIETPDDYVSPAAAAAITWTRCMLSDRSKEFLASLPLVVEMGDMLFVHADASAPSEWNYVTCMVSAGRSLAATQARVTFCGHVHVPQLFRRTADGMLATRIAVKASGNSLAAKRQWLVVVGSVGQPRDGDASAAFATYDTEARILTSRRVGYDVEAVARRIREEGLPESLARRLVVGR
jgi:diadenosine tetraphosphatase ApaH/serine/threonine PP2A family protein phosphatase